MCAPNICLSLTPLFSDLILFIYTQVAPTLESEVLSLHLHVNLGLQVTSIRESLRLPYRGQGHSGVRKPRTPLLQQHS